MAPWSHRRSARPPRCATKWQPSAAASVGLDETLEVAPEQGAFGERALAAAGVAVRPEVRARGVRGEDLALGHVVGVTRAVHIRDVDAGSSRASAPRRALTALSCWPHELPCTHLDTITVTELPASVDGCEECLRTGGVWLHLRVCLECGYVGCCDDSPGRVALKHVLRQDPDIILVGELRDLETTSVAVTAAETGHLVLATLHTQSAAQTIDRLIDIYPPHQQQQIRAQLANCLQGVVTQALAPRKDGIGRTHRLRGHDRHARPSAT